MDGVSSWPTSDLLMRLELRMKFRDIVVHLIPELNPSHVFVRPRQRKEAALTVGQIGSIDDRVHDLVGSSSLTPRKGIEHAMQFEIVEKVPRPSRSGASGGKCHLLRQGDEYFQKRDRSHIL